MILKYFLKCFWIFVKVACSVAFTIQISASVYYQLAPDKRVAETFTTNLKNIEFPVAFKVWRPNQTPFIDWKRFFAHLVVTKKIKLQRVGRIRTWDLHSAQWYKGNGRGEIVEHYLLYYFYCPQWCILEMLSSTVYSCI